MLTLFLGFKCNLRCRYCYETEKNKTFSFGEIKSVIDSFDSSLKEIEILGGEPFYDFKLFKNVFNYLIEKGFKTIIVSTNGTLLNDEIIVFLKTNSNFLKLFVSFDGDKFSNQLRVFQNQKGSFDVVLFNIKKLLENKIDFIVHSVLHLLNIAYLKETIIFFDSLGIKKVDFGFVEENCKNEFFKHCFFENLYSSFEYLKIKNSDLEIISFENSFFLPKCSIQTENFEKIIEFQTDKTKNDNPFLENILIEACKIKKLFKET